MDLLEIVGAVWRRKFFAIPVILFTAIAGVYFLKIKPPVYQASASLLIITPQPPTTAQIAASPKLQKINRNNPYLDYGNLQIAGDAVIQLVTSPASWPALQNAGVNPKYTMSLSTDVGDPPIIEITGSGRTPQEAINSAAVLSQTAATDLSELQKAQGVNRLYMLQAAPLVRPTQAVRSNSGKLRSVIAVLALGALLLFIVISVADAVDKRRARSRRASIDNDLPAGHPQGVPIQGAPIPEAPPYQEAKSEPPRRKFGAGRTMDAAAARARREAVRR
jgi:capsular polysaccharide biosynthesis protein